MKISRRNIERMVKALRGKETPLGKVDPAIEEVVRKGEEFLKAYVKSVIDKAFENFSAKNIEAIKLRLKVSEIEAQAIMGRLEAMLKASIEEVL